MGPRPELAMPISTVMSLNSEPQRGALKTPAVQSDAAGKDCVGMRSSRKSNPTLMAQSDAKRGMTLQIPSERMSVQFQVSPAGSLPDSVGTDSKVKRILPRGANVEIVQRKSLNKAPRLSLLQVWEMVPSGQVARTHQSHLQFSGCGLDRRRRFHPKTRCEGRDGVLLVRCRIPQEHGQAAGCGVQNGLIGLRGFFERI